MTSGLGELKGFICSTIFESLMIIGDFNVDFNCGGMNCAQLQEFMDEYDLTAVDLGYRSHINFTYENSRWLCNLLVRSCSQK